LLEISGAMTGGSSTQRSGLFGTGEDGESDEAAELKKSAARNFAILEHCEYALVYSLQKQNSWLRN